jgi:hypothetical protein
VRCCACASAAALVSGAESMAHPPNGRESAGQSSEIYGDPTPNPADTEMTVVYFLR